MEPLGSRWQRRLSPVADSAPLNHLAAAGQTRLRPMQDAQPRLGAHYATLRVREEHRESRSMLSIAFAA